MRIVRLSVRAKTTYVSFFQFRRRENWRLLCEGCSYSDPFYLKNAFPHFVIWKSYAAFASKIEEVGRNHLGTRLWFPSNNYQYIPKQRIAFFCALWLAAQNQARIWLFNSQYCSGFCTRTFPICQKIATIWCWLSTGLVYTERIIRLSVGEEW